MLEGCIVSTQERCKLEDRAAAARTQVTQAVVQQQGMSQKPPQSGQKCSLRRDLDSSITAAVQVRLEWCRVAAPPTIL